MKRVQTVAAPAASVACVASAGACIRSLRSTPASGYR